MKNQIIDTFWENFNMSRCKTAMLGISLMITAGLVFTECLNKSSEVLTMAFFTVIGFWTGRSTKAKDKNMSFEDYNSQFKKIDE